MSITFQKYQSQDTQTLIDFITSESWVFHTELKSLTEDIQKRVSDGYYDGLGVETFWILLNNEKVGFIRIYDLEDETPLFDLRLSEKVRGQGIGTEALRWLKDYVFKSYPEIIRIEGYTRKDNIAMRRVFQKSGFVKESQPRACWSDSEGNLHDSVGYGVIRRDWETKTVTPVKWEE